MKWLSRFLLLALAGCSASKLDANSAVTISGTGLAQGGAPLSNTPVVFFKQLDVGELLTAGLQLTASLGTICLADPSNTSCSNVRTTTTDGQGAFSFSLKGSDTQGSLGLASTIDLSVGDSAQSGESRGAATTEEFQVQVAELKLNDLRIWHPTTAFAAAGAMAAFTFDAFPYGTTMTGVAFQTDTSIPVWSQLAASGAALDVRLLEDTHGTVMATAQTTESLASGGSATFYFHSGQRAYTASSTAPPSRGAACFVQSTSGASALSPCVLTDGDMGTPFSPLPEPACSTNSGCNAQANNWAYVALTAPAPISLIVVRGLTSSYVVETSSDATAWISAGVGSGGAQSFTVSTAARYVRVRALSPQGHVTGLSEISVW